MARPRLSTHQWRDKHDLIITAAITAFLRDGYTRASVDSIAAAAGVGKQTVYGHFGSKESLFLAAVEAARRRASDSPDQPMELVSDSGDPLTDLTAVGQLLLRVVLSPDVAALHRLTIAELSYHPELQESWAKDAEPQASLDAIAEYFASCDRAGRLRVSDPQRTAQQFVLLLVSEGRVRALHGTRPLSDAERRQIAASTADLIVRAHRP